MEITVETVGPCRKRVHLVIPAERVRQEMEESLRNAASHLRLPGFRPGHVPRSVIEKRYGTALRRDVKETLVNDGYQQAIKDHKLVPLSSPEIDFEKIPLDDKSGLAVDLELDVRPDIDPTGYRGVKVALKKAAVDAKEVDEQIEEIRRQRRRPVKDEGGALAEEGFALASIEFLEGERSLLKRDTARVLGGDFEKKAVGKRAGESVDVPLTFPEDFEVKDAAGKPGTARLGLREIYKLVPPTDAELLKDLDVPDLETLKKEIERRIREAKEGAERRRIEEEVLDRAVDANPFELPDRIVDEQLDARLSRYRAHLTASGQEGDLDAKIAEERAGNREEFVKGMRRLFLLEAIARKEKLFVTEDEVDAELRAIAQRNRTPADEVRSYYEGQGLLPTLRMDLLEGKVRGFLFESAEKSEG